MAECYLEFADDGLLAVIPEYGWDIDGSGCALSPPYKADSLHLRNAAKLNYVPMDTWKSWYWKSYPVRRVTYKTCKYIYCLADRTVNCWLKYQN